MTDDEERAEFGDVVELESGNEYPVMGFEEGRRCVQLPLGPLGGMRDMALRSVYHGDYSVVRRTDSQKDALFWAYKIGYTHGWGDKADDVSGDDE